MFTLLCVWYRVGIENIYNLKNIQILNFAAKFVDRYQTLQGEEIKRWKISDL